MTLFIKLIKAFSIACFSFIGYTVVSISFALLSKVKIEESGADIKILAQFISTSAYYIYSCIIRNVKITIISFSTLLFISSFNYILSNLCAWIWELDICSNCSYFTCYNIIYILKKSKSLTIASSG